MRRLHPKSLFPLTIFLLYAGLRMLYTELLFFGMVALGLFFISFLTIGGFEAILEVPFEDTSRYKECSTGIYYDFQARLDRERKNKNALCMEQGRQWKKALIGLVIIIIGIIIEVFEKIHLSQLDSIVPLLFGTCIGLFVEAWGAKMMWMAFLNSSYLFANKISKFFMIRSISIKIEEESKLIAILTKRLNY